MSEPIIEYFEFSLVIPKYRRFSVGEAIGPVLGWMTAQGLNPTMQGGVSVLESGSEMHLITITSNGSSMLLDLYSDFDPIAFARIFGFNIHEDELLEEDGGDYSIRTHAADAFIATGARSTVLVTR